MLHVLFAHHDDPLVSCRLMTPSDLLHSLVAVFPPEDSNLERSGALKGDRHTMSAQLPEMIKVHITNSPFALNASMPRR